MVSFGPDEVAGPLANVFTHNAIVILRPPVVVPGDPNKISEGEVGEVAA